MHDILSLMISFGMLVVFIIILVYGNLPHS
ncbi:putative holin-like toxin [Lederbergia ruris]